jgi:ankyrin repeat protein
MNSLAHACRTGNEGAVAELLVRSEAAGDLNVIGDHGTPLHEAIVSSHFGVARLLIEAGADVTCLDPVRVRNKGSRYQSMDF